MALLDFQLSIDLRQALLNPCLLLGYLKKKPLQVAGRVSVQVSNLVPQSLSSPAPFLNAFDRRAGPLPQPAIILGSIVYDGDEIIGIIRVQIDNFPHDISFHNPWPNQPCFESIFEIEPYVNHTYFWGLMELDVIFYDDGNVIFLGDFNVCY